MTLELVKIEEGLMTGEVLFHKYITKTKAEVQELKRNRQQKLQLKQSRKRQQELNVKKKLNKQKKLKPEDNIEAKDSDNEYEDYEEEDNIDVN